MVAVELIAPPGERYEYSNANYVTLVMIIQTVTGQSYETYIREHIFQPLDMQNSFASKTEAEQGGLAVGYQKWFGIPVASVSWVAVISGVFAVMWGLLRTGIVIAELNKGEFCLSG